GPSCPPASRKLTPTRPTMRPGRVRVSSEMKPGRAQSSSQLPIRSGERLSRRNYSAVRRINPNTKHQTPEKLQARSAGRGLELGTWDFFGVWSLVLGVSIPGFLWSLVLGIWCFVLASIRYTGAVLQRLAEQLTPGGPLSDEQVALAVSQLVDEEIG